MAFQGESPLEFYNQITDPFLILIFLHNNVQTSFQMFLPFFCSAFVFISLFRDNIFCVFLHLFCPICLTHYTSQFYRTSAILASSSSKKCGNLFFRRHFLAFFRRPIFAQFYFLKKIAALFFFLSFPFVARASQFFSPNIIIIL